MEKTAKRIFEVYSEIDKIYITADGQGFTAKEKADNHAAYLSDKEIKCFNRNEVKVDAEPNEIIELKDKEQDDERAALLAEYEELYGQKANPNIGTEKLKARIEEKKAEGKN